MDLRENRKTDTQGTCFNCQRDIEACICSAPMPPLDSTPNSGAFNLQRQTRSGATERLRAAGSQVGDIIDDKYEILAVIGAGGMGKVFKAKHVRIDRYYAIKVLKDGLAEDSSYRSRFEQEAKAASRLNQTHLVAVYDYGMTKEGEPYIVMDYVSGHSLDDLVKSDQPINVRFATTLFMQICAALAYAHDLGIVHRDLKPSNVMLTDSDGKETIAKVLDFGIAKTTTSGHTASQALTQAGDVMGGSVAKIA